MFPISRTSRIAAGFRLSFSLVLTTSPLALSVANAQQAAMPAAELDAITVEGQQTKKKAAQGKPTKAKAKAITKGAPSPVAVAEPVEAAASSGEKRYDHEAWLEPRHSGFDEQQAWSHST